MPSYKNTRFTLMAFPQSVDSAGLLSLNIVFIPRNISPLEKITTPYNPALASAFADVQPSFVAMVVNNPDEFPGKVPANERVTDITALLYPSEIYKLYKTLKEAKKTDGTSKYFDIDEERSTGKPGAQSAPVAVALSSSVKKYLPVSYRKAFNFTAPRTPNAVIDDSYLCAIRGQKPPVPFVPDNKVSWGKVYAHLLRQPLLAKSGGLLYKTTIQLVDGDFDKGGWLYLDIKPGTDYAFEQTTSLSLPADVDGPFIARYAARIPILKKGEARPLFAPVLFPVLNTGASPTGIYDELFIESARFNDGFASVVHANQPVSHNLLKEEQDGFHPQKEMGIRLGWEDEQILIWYLRQLAIDETVGTDRLDAPLGVNGFHIDVRLNEISGGAVAAWDSLTAVQSNGSMSLEDIEIGSYKGELPFQVYPTKLDSAGGTNYWLPIYFGNWNNASMVLPDRVAARLYANEQDEKKAVTISDTYSPADTKTKLLYGNTYDFRVRMCDISGGGPETGAEPLNDLPSHIATIPFKRYVAPNTLRIINSKAIRFNTDDVNFEADKLEIARPLLGFPSVVYTGKYADPVSALLKASQDILFNKKAEAFGIPDPDVVKVELKVEVETLQLDNLASDNGQEHYITLYKTYRTFPAAFSDAVEIPVEYVDEKKLNLLEKAKPFTDLLHNDTIKASTGTIILPTARHIRLTLRAVCEGDDAYWGNLNDNTDLDSRYGKTTVLKLFMPSKNEQELFAGTKDPQLLQGIYLQPDPVSVRLNPIVFKTLQGANDGMPDIVQRLAKQLDVECKGTTLLSRNGERLQFWCSNMVRHTMAPDNSSLTFANKKELTGHWLVCTSLYIDRDWTWDGLETSSIIVQRRRRWGRDSDTIDKKIYETIGDLEMRRIASFQAIQHGVDGKVHRDFTRLIFIDVIDMHPAGLPLPDTAEVQYTLQPQLRTDSYGNKPFADGEFATEPLLLPTTINPTQVPKLVGAGIALSPYVRNVPYSATEPRQRFLWLEFDRLPDDDHDDIFCRVLAYAPDQLLSNNNPELMTIPDESPLPIDPEYVRTVTSSSGHEHSGLGAMQKLEKSIDKERHFYLLPTPPGLHPESPELFGLFTYEFRYGHSDRVWSTAQGRFGRQLRVTGLQHPAPNMMCMVTRDEKKICVSAPYASSVYNGKNVTSDPPRTSIWCLLYAQVKQADGRDYRNILLDEIELPPLSPKRFDIEFRKKIERAKRRRDAALVKALQLELSQLHIREKEGVRYAKSCFFNKDVVTMLELYGLPLDSSLSVLCVEIYGQITKISEHINNYSMKKRDSLINETVALFGSHITQEMTQSLHRIGENTTRASSDPLGTNLGLFRILRTSPLTEVPFICCVGCE
ncbi:MAG: hypothetical protein WCK32_03965 [Chlorobiaceae bacterium]